MNATRASRSQFPRQRTECTWDKRHQTNPDVMLQKLKSDYEVDMYSLLKHRGMTSLHALCVENDVYYLTTDTKDTLILKLLEAKVKVPAYKEREN